MSVGLELVPLLRLRKILLFNYPFYLILSMALIYTFMVTKVMVYTSKYQETDQEFTCRIKGITKEDFGLKLDLFCLEKMIGNLYYEEQDDIDKFVKKYQIEDQISIKGKLSVPQNNTIPNLFNYRKYLFYNQIYYLLEIEEVKLVAKNKNIFYQMKNYLLSKTDDSSVAGPYLKAFVLGDMSSLKKEVKDSYQSNGISHLLAVSGMQISIFAFLILGFLKKIKVSEKKRYFICLLFLLFYLFLTNGSPSILRASLFFFLLTINKVYYFYIKTLNLFFLTLALSLFYHPFLIYNLGFLYSFIISFYLILFSDKLGSKNYLWSLFKVSLLSFIVSLPITIFNNFSINILGVFYNLFFVPFVNIIVFPLSLITLCLPFLRPLFIFFINLLEGSSLFLSKIKVGTLIFCRPSLLIVLLYYVIITVTVYLVTKRKYYGLIFLMTIFFCHYHYNDFFKKSYLIMIDVGQGDSLLLFSNSQTVLIDTGGNYHYHLTDRTIYLLKSLGIKHLDYLFLTHGDYDHLGDAINLINNFPVKKVYFNQNQLNDLELKVIQVLKDRQISYSISKSEEMFKFGAMEMFLLGQNLGEENDSSLVLLVKIFKTSLLLMGDASEKTEQVILSKYYLGQVDIIKLGHHGSKTSTTLELLRTTKPKMALISVGRNNLYRHPSQEVMTRLDDYDIEPYLTSRDGSIKIIFEKKLTILKYPA